MSIVVIIIVIMLLMRAFDVGKPPEGTPSCTFCGTRNDGRHFHYHR